MSGKSEGFENKKKVCGRIPYGYEKKNGIISPNSDETKVVQYIYKKYLDPNPNDGLLDIRQERNEPVATPTPRPTLSEALGEPELFPEFK